LTLYPLLYVVFVFAAMELVHLLGTTVWAFQPSAFYTESARQRLMRDADRMLYRLRASRVRDGFRPARREYLHRACCDVSDLLDEVKGWLTRWPDAMAALAIAAEGAHLHPDILEFTYSRELPKMVSALFSFEAIRGSGLGRLAEFRQDGEWCSREEAAELLLPIEREAREMVQALLEALPEIFG
jgi:hypothetical protein